MAYYSNWNSTDELEPERCVDEKEVGTTKCWRAQKNINLFLQQSQNYLCLKSMLIDGTRIPPLRTGVGDDR